MDSDSNDTGFFFGNTPVPGGAGGSRPEPEEPEAIEVGGEPISRNEAKKMGAAVDYDVGRRASRAQTTRIRRDSLPADVSPETAKKIDQALGHLKRNEIQDALALAQEAVWEYPSLVAAKIIIARCFIARQEFDKSLALLQAIPGAEKTADVYYYMGLSLSRLGRIPEAIEALRETRAKADDPALRKRTGDLLAHMQAAPIACPSCGAKVPYKSTTEVDGQRICANCARGKRSGDADDDDEEEEAGEYIPKGRKRRRKKLKPPLSKADIFLRFLFVVLIVVVLGLGVYALYLVSPAHYGMLRDYLPASWPLPQAPQVGSGQSGPRPPDIIVPDGPVVDDSLEFTLPPVTSAVVGVELRHKLGIVGMEDSGGIFDAKLFPVPSSPFVFDEASGEFVWTPAPEDAGESFTLTLSAVFGDIAAPDQVSSVRVSAGPKLVRIGEWSDFSATKARFLFSEDMLGSGTMDLLLVSGDYWNGGISLYQMTPDGTLEELVKATNSVRPAGAGVISAAREKWIGVADYGASRLRFFALRNDSISEMAITIDLPGRPILAGFEREFSLSAVLCRLEDSCKVVAYRQEGQLQYLPAGEWEVSNGVVWRRIFLTQLTDGLPPTIVLAGSDFSNSILLMDQGTSGKVRIVRHGRTGNLIDAALARDGRRLYCLVEREKRLFLETLDLQDYPDGEKYPSVPLDGSPYLGGMVAAGLAAGNEEAVLLSADRAAVVFGGGERIPRTLGTWPMAEQPCLFGGIATLPRPDGDGDMVVFVGADGGIWSLLLDD